jgi:gluconokinase
MMPTESAYYLALDLGSSSLRAALLTPAGDAQASCQLPYPTHYTDHGAEIDADALLALLVSAIDQVLAEADGLPIAAVAMATMAMTLLGLDAEGRPSTPVYTWADGRGGNWPDPYRAQAEAYAQRTGARLHPSFAPARLAWLASEKPALWANSQQWLSFAEYAYWRWLGVAQASISVAAWSGLLNRHSLAWDSETLAWVGVQPSQLSAVSNAPLSGLQPDWAARWPTLADALWYPAIADGFASNLGMGCTEPNQVAMALGTSGALRVLVPGRPAVPAGLFGYAVDDQHTLLGGAVSNVGNLYAWLSQLIGGGPDVLAAAAQIPANGHGLTILPFLAGERAPGWRADAQAAFVGMTLETTPAHLLRAALESVAYRFLQIWQSLAPSGILATEAATGLVCIASGGPTASNPLWVQILADVLNLPIQLGPHTEATLRGALYWVLGQPAITSAPAATIYRPNAGNQAAYQAGAARQEALYAALLGKNTERA